MTTLLITGVHHDLGRKRSVVSVVWQDDREKHLGLVIPFECPPEQLKVEAEEAVRALAGELETAKIESA